MILNIPKSKHYLLLSLKVLILGLTSSYIYVKLYDHSSTELNEFIFQLFISNRMSVFMILTFITLAGANWFFEILKWKTVVSTIQDITFKTAMIQSLYSLTVSLATPNRIGDYGAKAFFFIPKLRKQILFLNFFSNSVQMIVTMFFGIFGLFYIVQQFGLTFSYTKLVIGLMLMILLVFAGYLFKEKQLIINGLTISKVVEKIRILPNKVKLKTGIYSLIRYSIFSYLFFSLLSFFGASISFSDAVPVIFAMYLLVSIVPTFFIFDVVVRGGTAVWLFSFLNISEIPVLSTVLVMWILNFVLPSIFGGYFMFTYKPETT